MDQHLDVNLPNLKILNLECVSGEISLLSLLTSITNNSPNLGTVTLWKIYLQNRYYYLHNLPVGDESVDKGREEEAEGPGQAENADDEGFFAIA